MTPEDEQKLHDESYEDLQNTREFLRNLMIVLGVVWFVSFIIWISVR